MSNYAISPCGEPVEFPHHRPKDGNNTDVRKDLLAIYESYATLYPNPRLAEERQERDQLLRAVSAASHAVEVNKKTNSKKGGFLGFLWKGKQEEASQASSIGNSYVENGDDELIYSEELEDEETDDSLCGTQYSLDAACIPPEAHSFARFHLASVRTRGIGRPNVARSSWERAGSSIIAITGLGEIVEFDRNGTGRIQRTCDRDELLDFLQGTEFEVAYARAASVGPNFLAVSWGLVDGMVVFYRRVAGEQAACWESVAVVGPTPAVKDNVGDVFLDEAGSSLLRVTDIVPLVVETDGVPASTLAVSRLGGFIELVPLPPRMWYGPEYDAPRKRRKRRRHQNHPEHYASQLADVASHNQITALTTSEFHADVICMEAFRTKVSDGTAWNTDAYPDTPPAEHVLAATGTRDGREAVSFWSVSTIFSEEPDPRDEIGFSICASVKEALDLGPVGPDVTIFVTKSIMKLWRKPRGVQIREEKALQSSAGESMGSTRVTTISVPAPVVSIRFNEVAETPYGAFLDWNGGFTLFECGLLERVVSQSLSDDEYELLYRNDDPEAIIPLAKLFVDRPQVFRRISIRGQSSPPYVTDVQWLGEKLLSESDSPLLAVAMSQPPRLSILAVAESESTETPSATPLTSDSMAIVSTSRGGIGLLASMAPRDSATGSLSFLVLDRLNPRSIVESLARQSKFKEAIEAARLLTSSDQQAISDVIEESKKRLWKSTHDFDALESILDDSFVVQEALSLGERSKLPGDDYDSISLFRSVHQHALKRLADARLGAAISIGGSQGTDSATREVRGRLIRLGTYELLCRHLSVRPSFERFSCDLLPVPIADLAKSFSRSCDLLALSIVCFRHRHETMETFDVIDEIPLSTPPHAFHHLLPVVNDSSGASYFLAKSQDVRLQDWSEMPQYLSKSYGVIAVLDETDKALVLDQERGTLNGAKVDIDQRAAMELWYVSRIAAVQQFSASLDYTVEFCRLGLTALRDDEAEASADSHTSRGLYKTLRYAEALENILMDQKEITQASSLLKLRTDHIECMGLVDLVALVFDGQLDPVEMYSRYNSVLLPLVEDGLTADDISLDAAISSYCVNLIEGTENDARSLLNAIGICSRIAALSRSSEERNNRLIKDRMSLTKLVTTVFQEVIRASVDLPLSTAHCRKAIDSLWSMYESLSMRLPSGHGRDEEMEEILHSKADEMFERLVIVDILSQWPGCSAFDLLTENHGSKLYERALYALCRSLCDQVEELPDPTESSNLLAALLSDISELDRLCFGKSVSVSEILTESLFSALLSKKQVRLVDDLLSPANKSWIKKDEALKKMLSFVNEAVFAGGADETHDATLQAAVAVQEILVRHFPDAQAEVQATKRYLDAAHFINSVIVPVTNCTRVTPEDLRCQFPLDVIETLLCDNPDVVVCDCKDWVDHSWALNANRATRDILKQRKPEPDRPTDRHGRPDELPPLPGRAVFHLAQLLGLVSDSAVIAVKCRIVHYGVGAKMYGASAAVCRTFFIGGNALSDVDFLSPVLEAIASVVSQSEYADTATKQELCIAVLQNFRSAVEVHRLQYFEQIMKSLDRTGYNLLPMPLTQTGEGRSLERSPLRVVERLLEDTLTEYSEDLCDLFSTLRRQSDDCLTDDSLLKALSRLVIFWCIAQSTRPKPNQLPEIVDASANTVLSLGSSLLLHMSSEDFSQVCVQELQDVLNEQASIAKNTAAVATSTSLAAVKPDLEVVRRLVGRGYSEHGARRAVMMTGNRGFDSALQWAVTHSLDIDFDQPIVIVKQPKDVFIDVEGMHRLKESLDVAASVADGTVAMRTAFGLDTEGSPSSSSIENEEPSHLSATPKGFDEFRDLEPDSLVQSESLVESASEAVSGLIKTRTNGHSSEPSCELVTGKTTDGHLQTPQKPKVGSALLVPSPEQGTSLSRTAKNRTAPLPKKTNASIAKLAVPKSSKLAPASPGSRLNVPTGGANGKGPSASGKPSQASVAPTSSAAAANGTANIPSESASTRPRLKVPTTQAPPTATAAKAPTTPPRVAPTSSTAAAANGTTAIPSESASSRLRSKVTTTRAPPPAATATKAPTTPSRSSLLKRGHAALKVARDSGSPASEERRRLIEEGRRLLQKAREAKKVAQQTTPKPPPPPPPPPAAAAVSAAASSNGTATIQKMAAPTESSKAVDKSDSAAESADGWDFDDDANNKDDDAKDEGWDFDDNEDETKDDGWDFDDDL